MSKSVEIRMKVSEAEAYSILSSATSNAKFQKGLRTRWQPRHGIAQRICWLFCWGNRKWAGQEKTTEKVREAFNQIFNKPYEWFEDRMKIEHAYIFRYAILN